MIRTCPLKELDLYNHPVYRVANSLVNEAIELMMTSLQMTEEEACDWARCWCVVKDGD